MGETTTTTTTTRTVKTTTTISINMSYLVPQGILKIVEIIVCIIVFSLVASRRSGTELAVLVVAVSTGYYEGPLFAMAIGIIFFLTTLILLILFLFNLVEKIGGAKIWYIIDTILNALAVLLFFIGFIVLCVYCSYDHEGTYSTYYYNISGTYDRLIAAVVFSLIAVVLYILSIVFAVKAGQAPMISVKA